MRFFRFLDRKLTARRQKAIITSYLFFGVPVGYIGSQIAKIISLGWDKYQFSLLSMIFLFSFDILIMLPFIINYFRHRKKFNNIIKKIEPDKELKVKALFDFDDFIKNHVYKIENISFLTNYGLYKNNSYLVVDSKGFHNRLKDIINKFELDDIKEERLKKLRKLKRLW